MRLNCISISLFSIIECVLCNKESLDLGLKTCLVDAWCDDNLRRQRTDRLSTAKWGSSIGPCIKVRDICRYKVAYRCK